MLEQPSYCKFSGTLSANDCVWYLTCMYYNLTLVFCVHFSYSVYLTCREIFYRQWWRMENISFSPMVCLLFGHICWFLCNSRVLLGKFFHDYIYVVYGFKFMMYFTEMCKWSVRKDHTLACSRPGFIFHWQWHHHSSYWYSLCCSSSSQASL